jgi:phosphatidate cytidylyltransferase
VNFEAVKPGIWIAYATVLCVLLIGSGATRVLINRYPERDYTELRLRVRTWWMIVPPVAIVLLSGTVASILLLAMMSGVALREYLAMAGNRHAECRGLWFFFLAIPLQYWFAYRASYVAFAACIPVFGLATLPLVMSLTLHTDGFLRVAASANLGLLLTVFSLSHIALLLRVPDASNAQGGAIGWVVFLLLITQLNDVAQYVSARPSAAGRSRRA